MPQHIPPLLRRALACEALAGAALGASAGASFGLEGCGWLLPLLVTALAWPLAEVGAASRRAAQRLASFAAFFAVAALLEPVLAVPAPWRLLAWLPLAALVIVHAAGAALVGRVAFAWRASPAVRLTLILPSLWTLLEAALGWGDAAMPWLRLGAAQGSGGPLAGALPYGGVLLAGWLTLSLAGALSTAAHRVGSARRRAIAATLGVAILVIAAGEVRWTRPDGTLRIALLQPGVALSAPTDDASASRLLAWYAARLSHAGAELRVTPQLAWPKTPSALPAGYLSGLDARLREQRADALIGLHLPHERPAAFFNGVVGIGASGTQSYRKRQIFPFGEFVPLPASAAAWLQHLLPAPLSETARGPRVDAPLVAGGHRVALALCWEAAFADAWRPAAAAADVLVNMSSDSALASAAFARQFRQLDQARAREFQKPVARTSDLRGTFVVDAAGRLVDELPDGTEGVLEVTVATRSGLTPYARWGDGVAWLWVVLALGLAAVPRRETRSGSAVSLRPHRPATGQVLPVAAVALVVVAALFHLMVNTGQAVQEKIRVTNAADAAAYSAALVEARALNYDAHLNRAIVANEMAIAQMVSFASWLRYFANASDQYGVNAVDVNFFLLPDPQVARLDAAYGGSAAVAAYLGGRPASDYAEAIVDAIGVLITAHDVAARALSLGQLAVHADLAAGARQQQTARQVVQAMDPALQAEIFPASHGFDTFARAYTRSGRDGDERARLADVVMRSRDAFTRERNWTVSSFGIPFVRSDPALKKRGGTDLVGYDEWRALDTLELHGRRWGCGKFGLSWCDDIQRPIGWGAVAVRADDTADARGWHGNAYSENPTTTERAESSLRAPSTAVFTGLPDTYDLADTDPIHEAATGLTVRVAKPLGASRLAGEAAATRPSGRLALFGRPGDTDQIAALSRAEVFFDRIAARGDGKPELGSLYNPYWRVRLVAPTASDRVEAALRQGGRALP